MQLRTVRSFGFGALIASILAVSSVCSATTYAQPEIASYSILADDVVLTVRNPYPRIAFTSFLLSARCQSQNGTAQLALVGTDAEQDIAEDIGISFVEMTQPIPPESDISIRVPHNIIQDSTCNEYSISGARAQRVQ